MESQRVGYGLATEQQQYMLLTLCTLIYKHKFMYEYICVHVYVSIYIYVYEGFPGGSVGKNSPAVQETQEMRVQSLGQEDPLEEGTAAYSSILAGESHGQRSLEGFIVHRVAKSQTGLKRVSTHTCMCMCICNAMIIF